MTLLSASEKKTLPWESTATLLTRRDAFECGVSVADPACRGRKTAEIGRAALGHGRFRVTGVGGRRLNASDGRNDPPT